MNDDQSLMSEALSWYGILLGMVGVLASFVFAGIVFILTFDPINALMQIALFLLFAAFLFLIGCMQIFMGFAFDSWMTASGSLEIKPPFRVKIGNTMFFLAIILWLVSAVVLFFARDLFYLGIVSAFMVAILLSLLYFQIWRPSMKRFSFI